MRTILTAAAAISLAACASAPPPAAPLGPPTWAHAAKTGVGASYEAYLDGAFSDAAVTGPVSRVWFSLNDGVITETMAGLVHEAQLRELKIFALGSDAAVDTTTRYLATDDAGRPIAPAYRMRSEAKDGSYAIVQDVLTDPDRQVLLVRVSLESADPTVRLAVRIDPQMANTGIGDAVQVSRRALRAWEGDRHLALVADMPFRSAQALHWAKPDDPAVTNHAMEAVLDLRPGGSRTLAVGFGTSADAARAEADGALAAGFDDALNRFVGVGEAVGWSDYLAGLEGLDRIRTIAPDGGALAHASALVLKVLEDRTHAGGLIASLSFPWGDTTPALRSETGYKGVWPRDFYQVATAFLALGDVESAKAAYAFLPRLQVRSETPGNKGASGWFVQKARVDSSIEWTAIQLDQTAMPIMLGWRLWKAGALDRSALERSYRTMLRPAAAFLAEGGVTHLGDDGPNVIAPPLTRQERWEEQFGHSPSTTAAVVAGLAAAADIARALGEHADAAAFLARADAIAAAVEATTFTTTGQHGDGRYFIRITRNADPNDRAVIGDNNGKPGLAEDLILDAGFLELVRYGVRRADAPSVLESLPELDAETHTDEVRVRYRFPFPGATVDGWRRYGNDGYGEDAATGGNYGAMTPTQRGRVWPLFSGERGHYDLAHALIDGRLDAEERALTLRSARALELFANEGLMIPEQVFDGVGVAPRGVAPGEGTNAATPLAWAHAEYVKLLRSIAEERVWDRIDPAAERYAR